MNNVHLQMRKEWNEMARYNAVYSVCSAAEFENPDSIDWTQFWQGGRDTVDKFIHELNLEISDKNDMVEIGCGLGRMTYRFAEIFHHVYAFDVSSEMVERAKLYWSKLKNVDFLLGNGNDLRPLRNNSVDFVFSYLVLQHVPESSIVMEYIRESGRVLKPNGIAFLQIRTSNPPTLRDQLSSRLPQTILKLFRATKEQLLLKKKFTATTIQEDFASRFASWNGCSVDPNDVIKVTNEVKLSIENVIGLGTQYTFYTLRKIK